MQIEVILGESPTYGELEALVRVLSDEVLTVPKIMANLSPDQREVLSDYNTSDTPAYYWIPKPDQREDTGYVFEEYWAFREKSTSKTRRLQGQEDVA